MATANRKPTLDTRKKPRQRRALDTVEVILDAAAQVLVARGPTGFTTNHVAERAGVSVGTVYQYYPNKAALLLQLHVREGRRTVASLESTLGGGAVVPPLGTDDALARMAAAIRHFFDMEAAEAPLRTALARLDVLFADAPEFAQIRRDALGLVRDFLGRHLGLKGDEAAEAAEVVVTVVSSMAERVTSQTTAPEDLDRWAGLVHRMLLAVLPPGRPTARTPRRARRVVARP
jgi:AcrR family transcriptional regulator